MSKQNSPAIEKLTSAVFDTGRRGSPRPGCDCVQCFGYCITDVDKMQRDCHISPTGKTYGDVLIPGYGSASYAKTSWWEDE